MPYRRITATVLVCSLSYAYALDNPAASKAPDPYQDCFSNATWIVPPKTLLAYAYNKTHFTPVSDQTVWLISKYNQGYFFGQSFSAFDNRQLTKNNFIGSVTTKGRVYITFYSGKEESAGVINGVGDLRVESTGECFFTMQMSSGQNAVSGVSHWSYMIPVKPGDFFYNNLPGTKMTIPEFLAQF